MKTKLLILSSLLFLAFHASAQNKDSLALEVIRTDADLKSGNNLDVLASFFQVALKEIGRAHV